MKKQLFFITLCIIFSCSNQMVRRIDDTVRNEITYTWNTQKHTNSKINRVSRNFSINVKKKKSTPSNIFINFLSSYPITQLDYFDTAYIVVPNQNLALPFKMVLENIQYKEKIDKINTTTQTSTDVNVKKTTSTEPVKSNSTETRSHEMKTDTETTTSTTTKSDTQVTTQILDKVKSERQINLDMSNFSQILTQPTIKIRLYTSEGDDFWDIDFTPKEIKKLNQLINNEADLINK